MIVYDDSMVQMYLVPEVPSLEWAFKPGNFIQSADFRRYLDIYLDLYRTYAPNFDYLAALYDTRYMGVLHTDDLDYASQINTPLLVAAGLRHEAFVLSEDVFGQLAVDDYTSAVEGLATANFTTIEQARNWLKACMPT